MVKSNQKYYGKTIQINKSKMMDKAGDISVKI